MLFLILQRGCSDSKDEAFGKHYAELFKIRSYSDASFGLYTATVTKKMMDDIIRVTCLNKNNLAVIKVLQDRLVRLL